MMYCAVQFTGSDKLYTYRTFFNDLVEGDLVEVMANGTLSIAKFVYYVTPTESATKWITRYLDVAERSKHSPW